MKRAEAERLYHKYTERGATVEFKFGELGQVDLVHIFHQDKNWEITVNNQEIKIYPIVSPSLTDFVIDLFFPEPKQKQTNE